MIRHLWAYIRSLIGIPHPLQRNLLRLQTTSAGNQKNAFALITGSTDGIGEAIAIELASHYGFNLVLHGRSPSKLEATKDKVKEACKAKSARIPEIITITADASQARSIDWEQTFGQQLKDVNVSILINNVGMPALRGFTAPNESFRDFKPLSEIPDAEIAALYDLNLTWTTALTKHLLPVLARSQTRKALIVNISSFMSTVQLPYLSVYCSVKAALNALMKSLSLELRAQGSKVECQTMIVGSVRTRRLAGQANASFSNPNASDFAKSLCRVLGDGVRQGTGSFAHALVLFSMQMIPSVVRDPILTKIGGDMYTAEYKKAD